MNAVMLTQQEKEFISYWEASRIGKKRFMRQFSIGLPLSVLIVGVIFINLFSGWNRQADMIVRSHSSVIIVILVAAVGITVFMTIFSSNYKWDQNEQRYQELKMKEAGEQHNNKPDASV
jgi:ATP/ADP translocase